LQNRQHKILEHFIFGIEEKVVLTGFLIRRFNQQVLEEKPPAH
jgi:hypothetical protein